MRVPLSEGSLDKIWRPFTQMLGATPPLNVRSAKEAILHLKNGETIIDAISSWWVITHGHCQPQIMDAIAKQSCRLDQVLFANFSHRPAEDLVHCLSKFLPSHLSKFFFTDNGSTSVEAALKMVIQYWQNLGVNNKNKFIAFDKSYHGDTVGAMSVGGENHFTKPYSKMLFSVIRVHQGSHSFDPLERFVNPFLEALDNHKENIAGIIIEPLIQGAGGMVMWPIEALEIIGREAKKYKVPLIFDEVMTGFGRTGKLFAFDHLSYSPDILCLSKGLTGGSLPLALTVANKTIYDSFLSENKSQMFFHGHSFTGNPISCAAATANLKILKDVNMEPIWESINKIHLERVSNFRHKEFIVDARVFGTVAAIEVRDELQQGYTSNISDSLTEFALKRGVFLRPLGPVIYLMPPYSITKEQLHRVWDVIDNFCDTHLK